MDIILYDDQELLKLKIEVKTLEIDFNLKNDELAEIEKIINNYVTEYCSAQHITIGLNAIREILTRMPLALDASQIEYMVEFKGNKNKSVRAAAKSLINFFRDVCP